MTANTKGVTAFLALSFGGAWAWLFFARLVLDLSLVNPLVQLPFGFMPAIAAVVVRRWITREGFADAGLRLRARTAWPYYLAAWLGPWLLAAASLGLVAVLGAGRVQLSALDRAIPGLPGWAFLLLLLAVVPLLAPVYWGEEFGWTSYLRPRLHPDRPLLSVVVTGLIWAVWHYPLAFLGYIEFASAPIGLAAWTVSLVLQEILLAWLFLRSRSVWTVSVAHSGNNMVLALLLGVCLSGPDGLGTLGLTLLPAVPLAVLCCAVGWSHRRHRGRGNGPRTRRDGGPQDSLGDTARRPAAIAGQTPKVAS
ncbi:CPBP family intramembrane glutamic endopeptidase [Streptomyces sp. URMC 123]|uniref:CPBP family intramembrane glutamic endopeptidase n=1 Tax=Streptomyces sp. URMC 123 TaxID=3423403 RepID=UPI003F53E423